MSFVSHAQNFEDVRLWRAFGDVEGGRYLDIGTQDPTLDSVSLAFYGRGWRGVHVEPTPAYAAAMQLARPDEVVIEAAVTNRLESMKFFEISGSGLSTGCAELAAIHAAAGWENRVIEVATITLAEVLSQMGDAPIHWLKIDVEGMEAEVLASWGEHPARPQALVIEATSPNTQQQSHLAWHGMVTERGYIDVAFDGLSRFFVHQDHAALGDALALAPNVFDGFQITANHFAAGGLVAVHAAEAEAFRVEIERLGRELQTGGL